MNTVLLCNLFSLPRIVYAMAEDGLFFGIFARVNPVTKVPVIAILVFGTLMATMALIFDLEALVQFLSIGTLLAYTFVAASVIVLRFQPEKTGSKGTAAASPNPGAEAAPSETQTINEENGELKQYESFSDKLQLVERQKTREEPGPGRLRAFWEPYLGRLLGGCQPGEAAAFGVLVLIVSSVSFCAVLVFGRDQLLLPLWSYTFLLLVFGLAYVLSLALIWTHQPQTNSKTFQVRQSRPTPSQPLSDQPTFFADFSSRAALSLGCAGPSSSAHSGCQHLDKRVPHDEAQLSHLDSIHRMDCYR